MPSFEIADSRLVILAGCRTIPLTRGKATLVSEGDVAAVAGTRWHTLRIVQGSRVYFYAQGRPGGRRAYLHRVIVEAASGALVDHVSGDGLDNTRGNLRTATERQNQQNRRPNAGNRFKGMCRERSSRLNPWVAQIWIDGKVRRIGVFPTQEEAARAYDAAALKHFGEFARLNFPTEAVASA